MRFDRCMLCASLLALPAVVALPVRDAAAQSEPTAGDRAQAGQSFREGVAAYQRGDYTAALAAFQTAYRLAPHPAVRVNMANCYVQLHQPAEALMHFEQFLAESPSARPAQRRDVERQVADLRRQLGEVRVTVGPDSVLNPLVLVDGHTVSLAGPVRLAVGHHVFEISADGYTAERREVDVTAGGQLDVDVRLRPAAAASANAAVTTGTGTTGGTTLPSGGAGTTGGTEPTTSGTGATSTGTTATTGGSSEATGSTATTGGEVSTSGSASTRDTGGRRGLSPAFFIAGAAVTGVAGLTALGCGIGALVANGTFENAVMRINTGMGDLATEQQRGHDAAVTARSLALVTDISLVVTGVAAITSVVLLTQTRWNTRPVTVTPVATSTGAGLTLGGRF